MLKVYLSSTFADLVDYRKAVEEQLRRMDRTTPRFLVRTVRDRVGRIRGPMGLIPEDPEVHEIAPRLGD